MRPVVIAGRSGAPVPQNDRAATAEGGAACEGLRAVPAQRGRADAGLSVVHRGLLHDVYRGALRHL